MPYYPPMFKEDLREQSTEDLREMLVDDLMRMERHTFISMEQLCMSPLIHVDSLITRRDIISEIEQREGIKSAFMDRVR